MKQNISTKAFVGVIFVVLALVGVAGWRTLAGNSAAAAANTSRKAPPAPSPGPTAEQLREMKEYNASHAAAGAR